MTWNESLHTCSATTSTIVTNTTSPVSTTTSGQFPAAANASVRLQISDTGVNVATVVATLTVAVTRAQARAATTTNS